MKDWMVERIEFELAVPIYKQADNKLRIGLASGVTVLQHRGGLVQKDW
jgi:hypothetical protein